MTPEENRFRERRSAFSGDEGDAPEPPKEDASEPADAPGDAPAGETPAGKSSSEGPPAGEPPARESPVAQTPRGEASSHGAAGPVGAPSGAAGAVGAPSGTAAEPADAPPAEDEIDLDRLEGIEIPDPSFLEIVQPLEFQALQFLGLAPLTESGETRVLPRWAKHVIDLLGLLEERTRGNLPEDEARYLERILSELRVRYMKVTS